MREAEKRNEERLGIKFMAAVLSDFLPLLIVGVHREPGNVCIDKDRASPSNDNFLITVRFYGSFVPLVTVLFVVERG